MRGHFDTNATAYPIGYLTGYLTGAAGAAGYKVTDMRSLKALHSQPIQKEQAVRIAAAANVKLQKGELSLRDNDTGIEDFVFAEVEKL